MPLTIDEIYSQYSVRELARIIEIKRLQDDGSYESDWQDVEVLSGLKLLDNSVGSISYSLANNDYSFGIISVGNVKVTLNSKNGQFDDESNTGSVFRNYIRHKSLIRIRDGYVDKYTDPDIPEPVLNTVFEGFIDATSDATKVDNDNLIQDLQCIDLLSFLLKDQTVADMGTIVGTTIKNIIYEILNRTPFTNFFSVSLSNINPGYNASSIDMSQYEGQTQLLSLFENLSTGHSYFYVENGVFYYNSIASGNSTDFIADPKKIIAFSGYNSGVQNVFEKLFWNEDDTVSYTALTNKYNRSQTINIKGITNHTQRQNVLNYIGGISSQQRREFQLDIPYYPDIKVFDEITVSSSDIYPSDAFIWGVSNWGEKRWRKALKADNILNNEIWLVFKIKHNNLVTSLTLQET